MRLLANWRIVSLLVVAILAICFLPLAPFVPKAITDVLVDLLAAVAFIVFFGLVMYAVYWRFVGQFSPERGRRHADYMARRENDELIR